MCVCVCARVYVCVCVHVYLCVCVWLMRRAAQQYLALLRQNSFRTEQNSAHLQKRRNESQRERNAFWLLMLLRGTLCFKWEEIISMPNSKNNFIHIALTSEREQENLSWPESNGFMWPWIAQKQQQEKRNELWHSSKPCVTYLDYMSIMTSASASWIVFHSAKNLYICVLSRVDVWYWVRSPLNVLL